MRYNSESSKWNSNTPDTLFGRLYNGYQADTVCPEGWRLTSSLDWFDLEEIILSPKSDALYEKKIRGEGDPAFFWTSSPKISHL